MKKWRVDYAFRKDGKYEEGFLYVIAMYMDKALSEANSILHGMAWTENWDVNDNGSYHDRFIVWNVGVMMDADEEVI